MKKRYIVFLLFLSSILISCNNKDIKIDWTGASYYLSGFNEDYLQYKENVKSVRYKSEERGVYAEWYYNNELLVSKKRKSHEEISVIYKYDEYGELKESSSMVGDFEFNHFYYTYNSNNKDFCKIVKVTDKNGLSTVYKEKKKKANFYECNVISESKILDDIKTRQETKTTKFKKGKIIEFSSNSGMLKPIYKFEYAGNKLVKLYHYDCNSQNLIFSYTYEYENNNISKVICRRHNGKNNNEENSLIYSILFSDFDSHGNWKKCLRIYKDNQTIRGYREIEYTEF